jgi:hypothetical protein
MEASPRGLNPRWAFCALPPVVLEWPPPFLLSREWREVLDCCCWVPVDW